MKLEDVFGVSGKLVKSHIERERVDDKFIDALRTDKQIIVFGASKQGKTALVKKYIPYEDNIVISLSPRTELKDIYQSILRKSGVLLRTSYTEGTSDETKLKSSAKVQGAVALIAKATLGIGAEVNEKSGQTQNYEEIEFNLSLPDDVSDLIHRVGKKKVIILENFHYLSEENQRSFAFDLRTFQDLKVKFVILGVWREANRLSQFNGELQDRVVEVPVEPWRNEDFDEIANKGEQILNIKFTPEVLDLCKESSFKSVGVFQELLKTTCREAGVIKKGSVEIKIGSLDYVHKAIAEKTYEYSGRHLRNLETLALGNATQIQKDKPLPYFMHYYIVMQVLELGFAGINGGVLKSTLMHNIKQVHHRKHDLKGSQLTSALKSMGELQSMKGISPPVMAYDTNSKMLKITDSTFYFFLKNANLEDVKDEILSPMDGLE